MSLTKFVEKMNKKHYAEMQEIKELQEILERLNKNKTITRTTIIRSYY